MNDLKRVYIIFNTYTGGQIYAMADRADDLRRSAEWWAGTGHHSWPDARYGTNSDPEIVDEIMQIEPIEIIGKEEDIRAILESLLHANLGEHPRMLADVLLRRWTQTGVG
jgi:hypothetical protein